jgi:hypothetical protein
VPTFTKETILVLVDREDFGAATILSQLGNVYEFVLFSCDE